MLSTHLGECHVDEVESALQTPRDDHSSSSRGTHRDRQKHVLQNAITTLYTACIVRSKSETLSHKPNEC